MNLEFFINVGIALVGVGIVVAVFMTIFSIWSRTRPRGRAASLTITVETGERIVLDDFRGTTAELEQVKRLMQEIAQKHGSSRYSLLWAACGLLVGFVVGALAGLWIGDFWTSIWIATGGAFAAIGTAIGRAVGARRDRLDARKRARMLFPD